jgi:hypothetical protein
MQSDLHTPNSLALFYLGCLKLIRVGRWLHYHRHYCSFYHHHHHDALSKRLNEKVRNKTISNETDDDDGSRTLFAR